MRQPLSTLGFCHRLALPLSVFAIPQADGRTPLCAGMGFLLMPSLYVTISLREHLVLCRATQTGVYEAGAATAIGALPLLLLPLSLRCLISVPLLLPPLCTAHVDETEMRAAEQQQQQQPSSPAKLDAMQAAMHLYAGAAAQRLGLADSHSSDELAAAATVLPSLMGASWIAASMARSSRQCQVAALASANPSLHAVAPASPLSSLAPSQLPALSLAMAAAPAEASVARLCVEGLAFDVEGCNGGGTNSGGTNSGGTHGGGTNSAHCARSEPCTAVQRLRSTAKRARRWVLACSWAALAASERAALAAALASGWLRVPDAALGQAEEEALADPPRQAQGETDQQVMAAGDQLAEQAFWNAEEEETTQRLHGLSSQLAGPSALSPAERAVRALFTCLSAPVPVHLSSTWLQREILPFWAEALRTFVEMLDKPPDTQPAASSSGEGSSSSTEASSRASTDALTLASDESPTSRHEAIALRLLPSSLVSLVHPSEPPPPAAAAADDLLGGGGQPLATSVVAACIAPAAPFAQHGVRREALARLVGLAEVIQPVLEARTTPAPSLLAFFNGAAAGAAGKATISPSDVASIAASIGLLPPSPDADDDVVEGLEPIYGLAVDGSPYWQSHYTWFRWFASGDLALLGVLLFLRELV